MGEIVIHWEIQRDVFYGMLLTFAFWRTGTSSERLAFEMGIERHILFRTGNTNQ